MKAADLRAVKRQQAIARARRNIEKSPPGEPLIRYQLARRLGIGTNQLSDALAAEPHIELVGDPVFLHGHWVRRIRALIDLPEHGVKAGDLGGYAAHHLNITGRAWASGQAVIAQQALLTGLAHAGENSLLEGHSFVGDRASTMGHSTITEGAIIAGEALTTGFSRTAGGTRVLERAVIAECTDVGGSIEIRGEAYLGLNTTPWEADGPVLIHQQASLCGRAQLVHRPDLCAPLVLGGELYLGGTARVTATTTSLPRRFGANREEVGASKDSTNRRAVGLRREWEGLRQQWAMERRLAGQKT